MEDVAEFAEANRDMLIFGGGGAAAPAVAPEWTMELGHMAIFGGSGGSGALRDPETEKEIYEHIFKQQMAYMDGSAVDSEVDDDDTVDASAVAPMAEQEECVGGIDVVNYYTGSSVGQIEIWLRDEGHRHEHYDEDVSKRGKFLAFEGVRFAKQTTFKVHVELDDNIDDTLRALGACMYRGEAPGSELETVVQHINTAPESATPALNVLDPGSKTWRQVLMMKPVTWGYPINIYIEMSLHNPHAVVVSAHEEAAALAANKKIRKQLK